MKKLIVLGVAAAWMLLGPAAVASTQITWVAGSDAGSDQLPCADGAHWVLSPAAGITSATLTFKGHTYTMVQSGGGSFSVDTPGTVEVGDTVTVTFEGSNYAAFLKLSHCLSTSPSPSETESPSVTVSPTETETPSETVSPSETESPSETVSPTESETTSPTKSPTVLGTSGTRGPSGSVAGTTAFTGYNATPFAVGAGLLTLVGLGLLYVARRRSA
jgi:hypothetical protein